MDVNEVDYIKIGQRIRTARTKLGWQQAEVAFRAGLTTSHMSHMQQENRMFLLKRWIFLNASAMKPVIAQGIFVLN